MLLPKKYLLERIFFELPKLACSSVVGSQNLDVWAVLVLKEEVESMELYPCGEVRTFLVHLFKPEFGQ